MQFRYYTTPAHCIQKTIYYLLLSINNCLIMTDAMTSNVDDFHSILITVILHWIMVKECHK